MVISSNDQKAFKSCYSVCCHSRLQSDSYACNYHPVSPCRYGTSLNDAYLASASRLRWRRGPAAAGWVEVAVAAKSTPLEISVGCRLQGAVRHHLRNGVDPRLQSSPFSLTAFARCPRPWNRTSTRPCREIVHLVESAFRPWTPKTHSLFGPTVHTVVLHSLLCARRNAHKTHRLPCMPAEMWALIFSFLTR